LSRDCGGFEVALAASVIGPAPDAAVGRAPLAEEVQAGVAEGGAHNVVNGKIHRSVNHLTKEEKGTQTGHMNDTEYTRGNQYLQEAHDGRHVEEPVRNAEEALLAAIQRLVHGARLEPAKYVGGINEGLLFPLFHSSFCLH